ncbi:MAG: lipoyl synthase [Endozoicomonadaceae bacterium]|nr:lipoyl synthase [Endozoicomonadaceae bacterium]
MSDAPIKPVKKNRIQQGIKLRGKDKMDRIPIKIIPLESKNILPKPPWLKVRLSYSAEVDRIKSLLRKNNLHSVCEEASCPNLHECFSQGTATFMILGDICTRRCAFCDVAHGRPNIVDEKEPYHLAQAISELKLKYVVITSVDRDDLRDGGAQHFANCIRELRLVAPELKIEILTPDFRGRIEPALDILTKTQPDIFNHNMETVSSLYPSIRPGSDYQHSLTLLKKYKLNNPNVTTKSGVMLGLGETIEDIIAMMHDMHAAHIDMITLGQYLQPSRYHAPVKRFVPPNEFVLLAKEAKSIGFSNVASGPLVRSSYHADLQAQGDFISHATN